MEHDEFSIKSWYQDYVESTFHSTYDSDSLVHVGDLRPQPHTTTVEAFYLGTGSTLYSKLAALIVANTDHELLLTTCFWAHSASSNTIAEILRTLSAKACARNPSKETRRIKVRICVSSLSAWQKLFHTQSTYGHIYSASKWPKTLNLPPPSELPGLEIQVKSVFVKPFSVMHPKFIICDRSLAVVPSCNVSWEDWFEGALVVREAKRWRLEETDLRWLPATDGGLVTSLAELWCNFWGRDRHFHERKTAAWVTSDRNIPFDWMDRDSRIASAPRPVEFVDETPQDVSSLPRRIDFGTAASGEGVAPETTCILLPHPHHANPRLSPTISREFPFVSPYSPHTAPPNTPLNNFTLKLLAEARTSIFILTPNLTAAPIITALRAALQRGVDVTVVTNRNLMVLEQRVTAGTTTQTQVRRLREWYGSVAASARGASAASASTSAQQHQARGVLRVGWFTALPEDLRQATRGPLGARSWPWRRPRVPLRRDIEATTQLAHPVRSHLKFTAVDARIVLLGSANLDRASVFTSQELGVAVESAGQARRLQDAVEGALRGRVAWEAAIGSE